MKTFRFALQPVLDARMREEDTRRATLAAAAQLSAGEQARAQYARDDFARIGRAFSRSASRLSPEAVRDAAAQLALLAEARECSELRLKRCADRELLARNAFAAARLERRRMEALRDRAYAVFTRESEHRETLALEEANATRHNSATLFASSLHN